MRRNNSNFADVLRKLSPVLNEEYIDMLAANTVWNLVLGILPDKFNGIEEQIMEQARKDTTAEKIDNIEQLTHYAEYLCREKPDYEYGNLELFSLALLQLVRYTEGDEKSGDSLRRMKDLYFSFITSYYIESVKNGTVRAASKNIRHFSEKIFGGHDDIRTKLNEVIS
jgi:hypothetical protein